MPVKSIHINQFYYRRLDCVIQNELTMMRRLRQRWQRPNS